MAEQNTQRRFAVMGENTFRIANKLMSAHLQTVEVSGTQPVF